MNPGVSVLIAEDEDSDFFLLERALNQSGVALEIRRVRDGLEGLEYLSGKGAYANRSQFPIPQLLIIDLKMPRMTGLELLEWLRTHAEYRIIPTVVMSSSEQAADVRRAYELGANTYFLKPTDFKTLVDLCKNIGSYWRHSTKPKVAGLT